MTHPELIAAKIQRVKDAAKQFNEAALSLVSDAPDIRIETSVVSYQRVDMTFPVETIQVKLSEVKTL